MPKRKPVVKARDAHARARIIAIAEQLVAGQIAKGELNPKNKKKFEAAVRQAVVDAAAAFYAAEEFIGG